MAVHFTAEQMKKSIEAHNRWWKGELDRPLVHVIVQDAYHVNCSARAPMLSQSTCTDFLWSPEQVIDAIDENMSRLEFLGDAFPLVNFDAFGPGVLAAFCGAKLDNSSGAVWFWPQEEKEIGDIHVRYDPENAYVQRIKALYRAGLEKWNGTVILGLPDFGGVMDVAATLRGTDHLLMDLYDEPEEVKRLICEIQTAWYEAYEDLAQVLKPQNAYSNWSHLVSSDPSYIIQCDFCYMISNPMFREFVLDTLRGDTERLTHTIYHLDGIGELNHLDDILALEKLNAVQWVPGAGQPSPMHWMNVFERIAAAGKSAMICGDAEDFLTIMDQIHGTPYTTLTFSSRDERMIRRVLEAR